MQVKVWLLGISPMVWRRVLVPDTCTLHELHGVIQVAMGEASKGSAGKAGGRLAEGGRASTCTSSASGLDATAPGRCRRPRPT